jgi:glycosyltransferase involved in cell wall biosynthesis
VFRERLDRRRLDRDLRAFLGRHDVVFFEWSSGLLAHATRLPKTCSIVTRLHRYELYDWADRVAWEAVDGIILVSEAKRRDFVKRFPAQAAKTEVLPVGVSLDRFPLRLPRLSGTVGTLCHLTPRKRVYDLVLAFVQMLDAVPSLTLRIGGDRESHHEDYHEAIRSLVERLGLQAKVTLDGAVTDTPEWYAAVDVFISHSYSEGLQVAPMEAMASGCYAVAHAWNGAEELVTPAGVYVTDTELAGKVAAFYQLPAAEQDALRRRMRSLVASRFDADKVHARIGDFIDQCARTRT